ncbi:(2Fe-2S)-binding protein [candidate division KSB1 bacterium]|nr:(2Fe-2S)-binding protein [candidate division KSB1 bacterium]
MGDSNQKSGMSRRNFIKGLGGGIAGATAIAAKTGKAAQEGPHGAMVVGAGPVKISLLINSKKHELTVDPRTTLLDALRNDLDYTGTKRVCNKGQCGACTVILNGKTILACSMLALDADGASVETIEGLAQGNKLHPLQEAFVKHDAMQCGFCTPGFIMSCVSLLRENNQPTLDEIKNGVAGNLCRCGTYPNIFKAVEDAATTIKKGG